MNSIFRWLHLSDIHFQTGEAAFNTKQLRDKLPEFLKKEITSDIDSIIITGDFRFAPEKEENPQKVLDYIKKIADAVNISDMKKVVTLPGNHDLSRSTLRNYMVDGVKSDYDPNVGTLDQAVLQTLINDFTFYKHLHKELNDSSNWREDNPHCLVEFKNVNFAYKTKNKGNIENISFIAEPNKITALVGHSGSGKTTITNLILRKYKIDSGEILIDNENIYEYSKDIYSKNVIGVNQSPFIFDMSIKNNLSLIDPNFENQIEACKRVGIHDYIMSLPRGYNTILTENATNFSGGQKQLLAIARTLLSKAEILIFDEVTSSLDTILVEKIKEIFENLKLDHTIIIITHKKDVMKIADKIIVLNKGKIVGQGSHNELMKNNKYYIDLQTNNYSSSHKKTIDEITIKDELSEQK